MISTELSLSVAQDLQFKKQELIAAYREKRRPNAFFQGYGAALEYALCVLWQDLFSGSPLCLLAIGGFGRAEMYPYSDLDLAIVAPHSLNPAEEERVAALVQTLWDIGLMPAAKVGSLNELCQSAQEDLSSDTALLEARFVCGNHVLADQLLQQLALQRDVAAFIEGKLLEQQQRHAKAQGSGSLLEPNIKTCPGGLRDIHTMLWLAKAQGLRAHFHSLVHKNILTRTEATLLIDSHRQLAKIRMDLHLTANRPEERLIFDLQTQLAEHLGLQDDGAQIKSEKLMKTLFRATKAVKQLNGILPPMLKGRVYATLPRVVHDLDEHYYQVGNLVAVKDLNLFAQAPEQIFAVVRLIQNHNDITGLAPKTLRAWWAAGQKIDADFYRNEQNRRHFIQFFHHGTGLTHILRALNLYGLLGHYLPAFGRIVGHMQHDLFHIYPVDDHILTVVRNMRRLAIEAHSHELPFASGLMHSFQRKHVLYLAALFHDIAKGRDGDHAELGVADARRFAADHFLDEADTELLAWLVEDHLFMSMTAQKEDIQDPDVVSRFCQKIQTQERLVALYLLTVADIRGTNPKIWNSWKASLFESLFQAALRTLAGEGNNQAVLSSNRQSTAMTALAEWQIPAPTQKALWQMLGKAYFVRHQTEEILWHLRHLAEHADAAQAHTRILPDTHTLQVMVYMPNQSKLFAQLCQIFSHQGLDILTARAFVTENNHILDTFELQMPPQCTPADGTRIQKRLQQALNQFVAGQLIDIPAPAKPKGRRARHLPIAPRVALMEEDNEGLYLLDVVTFNRSGLLANIAGVLSDFDIAIQHARIITLDERVEDSFLLRSPHLSDTKLQLALQQALLAQISA